MKKYLIYIVLVLLGVILGRIIFSDNVESHEVISQTKESMFTCSMHPQIIQQEPGDCPICGMNLVKVTTMESGNEDNSFVLSENAMKLANIETVKVSKNNNSGTVELSGELKENLELNYSQTAHFSGRIEKLAVKFNGEEITKGSLIAYVYSPELVTAQKEFLEAIKIKESQPQLYRAVRNKLKFWKLSEKEINAIEKNNTIKSNFPIYAGKSGIVSNLNIKEGDHVMEGGVLFTISNISSLWVVLDAYEKDISKIKKGDKLKVLVSSFSNEIHEVEVDFIDPMMSSNSRTISVRGKIDNKNGRLKPGMFVKAELIFSPQINGDQNNIFIPKTSVLWTGKRSVVYVKVGSGNSFELREVILGNSLDMYYEIISGVDINDEVVVNGTFTVDAAAQLAGKKSMMSLDSEEEEFSTFENNNIEKYMKLYFQIKDHLVTGDIKGVNTVIEPVLLDSSFLNSAIIKSFMIDLKYIYESTDLKTKRERFLVLSEKSIRLVEKFDHLSYTVYLQHCPMAFTVGGSWLSQEKEIMNPYFGDAMLHCGTVKEVFN